MDVGEVFALQNEILLGLLILGGIYVAVLALINYWWYKIPQTLKKIPLGFNQIQTDVKSILLETQSYSPDDPLPYGPIMSEINRQLDAIANQLVQLKNHYINIQHKLHELSQRSWQMILAAPIFLYSWIVLQSETSRIQHEIIELEEIVNSARSKVKDLDRQAWLLGLRARAVFAQEQKIRRLIDDLSNQKLYGDTFDQSAEKEDQVLEAIESIPEYFLLADEDSISEHATGADVSKVYSILRETEPILEELQNNLTAWTSGYEILAEKADLDRQQLEHVEELMNSTPDQMNVDVQENQLLVLRETLKVLTDTLSRLEIESFNPVEQELDQVLILSTEIGGQLRHGLRNYASLKNIIEKLAELQSECSELFSDLLKSSIYPVLWVSSQTEFMDLNKRISELGPISNPRELEEVDKDLAAAEEILVRLNSLNNHFRGTDKFHKELLQLYDSDEIQKGTDQFEGYYLLGSQISVYHPDNWSKVDAAESYLEDVKNLDSQHKAFLEREPSKSIPESEIDIWLMKAGNLVQDHKDLRIRSEKIQARLQFIQTTENSAKEHYDNAQKALNQIKWLANSNALLEKTAEKDMDRLNRELDQCALQMSQSTTGIIDKKAHAVQAAIDSIEVAGNRWLEQLNQDIDERSAELAEKVDTLSEIAALEDPAIDKVQRLLAQEDRKRLHMQTIPSFHMSLDDIVSELKARSVFWQELFAAQQELKEIVATPLLDAYNNAENQRERAADALAEAERIIPEQRKWPPCTVSISEEKEEFAKLDSQGKSIISQKTRAIWAVRQFGELAASYQTLAGKVERSSQWASQEQMRIQDLESEIDRLSRQWQRQERLNANDPEVVASIREMRAQANLSVEQQKQFWLSTSTRSTDPKIYESMLQTLMDVARSLRSSNIRVHSDRDQSREIHLNSTAREDSRIEEEQSS